MIFITRKKFEREIERRIKEEEEKRCMYERIGYMEKEIHERINRIEKRLNNLEIKPLPPHLNKVMRDKEGTNERSNIHD